MTAGFREFGRHNSPNSRQDNTVQHDTQQALAFINQGRLQEAEAIYKGLIQQGVGSHVIFGNLGGICIMQGRYQEAATFLRQALSIQPDFPDALGNLGIALRNQGDLDAAVASYRKALAIKPNFPDALTNLGDALKEQGDPDAAVASYRQALHLKPNYPEALNGLGAALWEQDNPDAAIASYRKALNLKPNYPEALNGLGVALWEQDNPDAAIASYRKALNLKPNSPETLNNLGTALGEQGDLEAAIDAYQKALALKPQYPEALSNLGNVLTKQGRPEAAIDAYQKALAIKPDFTDALSNLGKAFKDQGKMDAAIDSYQKALAIRPDSKELLLGLASTLPETGDLQTAVELARKAVSLDPDDGSSHLSLALWLFLSGDYSEGWQEYKWRFAANKILHSHALPKLEEWDGNNHTPGERLVVISEQGLGDTLQFMRYIPYLNTMGIEVCFCAQPKLHGLIQTSGLTTTLCDPDTASGFTTGKWISLLSLPAYLKVGPHNPLTDTAYLKAPQPQVLHWKQKLAAEHGPVIGLNWQGNPQAEKDGHLKGRSLPLAALAPLTQATAASFLSLQKGPGSEQLMDCSFKHRFVACQEEINQTWDFLDTAAIVVNCDLIITVDTAVAHLAAGLGKPTWLLLKRVPDWRWGMEGDTSFWYPSMRLFRQRERGNWVAVMERVVEALKTLPIKEAEPIKTTSPPLGQADDIHHAQYEGEQQALAFINQGRLQEAEAIYKRLIQQGAGSHVVFGNLGAICVMQGKHQEAATFLRQALAIQPDFPNALGNLGIALKNQGDLDAAVASYRKALAMKPDFPDALANLGDALKEQGDLDAAVASYRQALNLKPNYPEALNSLGVALWEQDHPEAAIASYRKALELKPNYPEVLNSLGVALVDQGNLEAAITSHRKAVSLDHENPDYHYNLASFLLLSGDYDNGWEEYEWRLQKKVGALRARPPTPQWNGHHLSSEETLMLVSEQGLEDTLQFMRYVPYLKTFCPGMDVAFCAQPKLHDLILCSGITPRVHTPEEANAFTAGKWLPLLSLPRHLKVSPSQPLVQTPYIKVPAEKVHHWQRRLATEERPIIGIHWQGNRESEQIFGNSSRLAPLRRSRSLPLEAFAPISAATAATFLSLQKGDGTEQLDHCPFRHRFVACQDEINRIWDFAETAAMVANCDLIITNDTALAHLAGGMGKTTWLLLKKVPDWRWGMEGDTTFWYPSMRFFRQRERGNWAEVMERVVEALKAPPAPFEAPGRDGVERVVEALKAPPALQLEPPVPAETTLPTPGQDDDIHHHQYEGEQQALALINQGQLQEAEAIYKRLIQQGIKSHLVFGNLGAICTMQGRNQEAITFLREALAIQPDFPDALGNLGIALKNQGDPDAAVASYRQALDLKPNYPEALNALGVALWEQDNLEAAIASYRKALELKPNYPEALNGLGVALWEQGNPEAAIVSYRKALDLKPNDPETLNNLGIALGEQGDLDAAVDAYQKALALKPKDPEALSNLGNVLTKQGRPEAAIDAYQKALAIKPDFTDALSNLGKAFKDQGKMDAAIASYRKALALRPDSQELLLNLAAALSETGDLQTAIELAREAVSLDPDDASGHLGLAIWLFLSGDYGNGWNEYEWRHKAKYGSPPLAYPPVPQWHGKNLPSGDTLMLVSEGGLGDTLQFMRYVPYLNKLGMDVAFCAQPKLHDLILSSGIGTRVHTPAEAKVFTAGTWLPLLSLPRHLKVTPLNPLVQTPYIKVPAEKIHHWQEKLATEKRPIIGIHWRGNRESEKISHNRQDLIPLRKSRSLPLGAFAPISAATTATFLSLQKGGGAEELDHCPFRHRFVACQDEINQIWDFAETAAMVANCDLIITNDTALAHLAGGMGKTTWLLLKKVPDWRWGMDGDTTFWYPSMHLFRQRESGNWAEVMERVVEALKVPPTKGAESLVPVKTTSVPVKTTSHKSRQVDDIHHAQHKEDKQQALAFINQGRLQEAEAVYKRLIQQGAGNHLVFGNLGAICIMQGKHQEATTFLKQALAIKPDFPDALANLGVALKNQGNLDAAVASYRQALNLKPNYPEALNNLGDALKEQGNLDAAVASYRQALNLKPNYPEALANLGAALGEQGDRDAAVVCFRKALDLKPDAPEVLYNLGLALWEQGNLNAAIVSYRQALDLKPNCPKYLNNLGLALSDQGNPEASAFFYRKTISLDHRNSGYHYGLAYALLLSGDYDNGWQEYEWRLKKQDFRFHAHPPVPQWHGQNHSPGETLMLVSEQGLGDTLQFMRYVPYLKTLFPDLDVAFCAQTKLHSLILCSGITPRVHTPEEANAFISGKWLPLLSLPRHLKVSPSQPLVQASYIKAPAERVHHWQEKLATEKRPIIGIHWQGQNYLERIGNRLRPTLLWKSRSFPLEAFAPISAATAATFLSLQKGDGAEQLDHCSFRHRFVVCQDEMNQIWDFVETAAMVANCDLIITNDTALAHLAGGMGQPTWLLLNKGSEWRWGMEGDTTFWYLSMRLFRQREWGNWAEVMERVARALEALPGDQNYN